MTAPRARIWSQNSEWRVRWRRRQLVRRGELLSPRQFCEQRGISRAALVQLAQRGQVFSVKIGGKPYIPAVLADRSVDQRRLGELMRRLPCVMPPMEKYFFFVGRRGSLGDKSPVQAVRRGKRFRVALRLADSEADEVRLAQALRADEESGQASRFDGHAFLRLKRATSAVPLLAR